MSIKGKTPVYTRVSNPTRQALGINADTFRICIGLENPDDLIDDLIQGLTKWQEIGDLP